MGTAKNPGPGFVPVVVASLLLLCTTIYMMRIMSVRRSDNGKMETGAEKPIDFRAVIGVLACMTGYALVLESLKYMVSTLAMSFVMLILLKPKKPVVSFLTALGIAVVSFVVLSMVFEVALPFGFLETLLFQIGRYIST
jgi:hypothetical protein